MNGVQEWFDWSLTGLYRLVFWWWSLVQNIPLTQETLLAGGLPMNRRGGCEETAELTASALLWSEPRVRFIEAERWSSLTCLEDEVVFMSAFHIGAVLLWNFNPKLLHLSKAVVEAWMHHDGTTRLSHFKGSFTCKGISFTLVMVGLLIDYMLNCRLEPESRNSPSLCPTVSSGPLQGSDLWHEGAGPPAWNGSGRAAGH